MASATLTGYLLLGEAPAPTPRISGFQTERKDSHPPAGSSDRVRVVVGWQRPIGSSSSRQVPAGSGSQVGEGWLREGVCGGASTPSFPHPPGVKSEGGGIPTTSTAGALCGGGVAQKVGGLGRPGVGCLHGTGVTAGSHQPRESLCASRPNSQSITSRLFPDHATWHAGSWLPNQGSNLHPLQRKRRVLTTGPPGKFLKEIIKVPLLSSPFSY